jgi:hypothetical protein
MKFLLLLLISFSSFGFYADKAKVVFRNVEVREQGYYVMQGGLLKESRKDIKAFLVFFDDYMNGTAYYPVTISFTSWGATAVLAMIEIDNTLRFSHFKGLTPASFLGKYHGGKIGLSLMAGFKGIYAMNSNNIRLYDSSMKLSTLGVDLSYVTYQIKIDKTYEKPLPHGWDAVID